MNFLDDVLVDTSLRCERTFMHVCVLLWNMHIFKLVNGFILIPIVFFINNAFSLRSGNGKCTKMIFIVTNSICLAQY